MKNNRVNDWIYPTIIFPNGNKGFGVQPYLTLEDAIAAFAAIDPFRDVAPCFAGK